MNIEITRYGNYVNGFRTKEACHKWMLDCLPYDKGALMVPETSTFEECVEIAESRGYKVIMGKEQERRSRILEKVSIVDVVKDLGHPIVRDGIITMDCPWCKGYDSISISARTKTFKCMKCREYGDVVTLVMKIKGFSSARAMSFLEKNYLNK